MEVIYYQNDSIVRLNSLYDNLDGDYVNDATVTLVRIVDSAGETVGGVTFPISMSYITDSDGNYYGLVGDELEVSPKQKYKGIITVVAGTTTQKFEPEILIKRRRG